MRNRLIATFMLAAAATSVAAIPADAAPRHRVLVCKDIRKKTNNGTLIGAIGGGLLGNAVAGHGARTEGTVLGAGVGAVAGHQIAKSRAKKRHCHYEWRG